MHTFEDEETGVTFHYNSDMSGDVIISHKGSGPVDMSIEMSIPAEALSRFFFYGVCDGDTIIEMLDNFKRFVEGVRDVTDEFAKKAFEGVEPKGSA